MRARTNAPQIHALTNVSPVRAGEPLIQARAAVVMEADSAALLYAKNPDLRLPPASTTKMATALLLARDLPPNAPIPISKNAAAAPGDRLGTRAGETFTARDLLHAMLLASANDASVAAAERLAGTESRFADAMNREAQNAGAANTHFVNASGLPAPGHYASARDLALIARAALRVPAFADAARQPFYALSWRGGAHPDRIANRNDLLNSFPGADGIKTGYTREAGYCFVGSASRGGRRLLTVVLNSPNWRAETARLLRYGFSRPRASGKPGGKPSPVEAGGSETSGSEPARSEPARSERPGSEQPPLEPDARRGDAEPPARQPNAAPDGSGAALASANPAPKSPASGSMPASASPSHSSGAAENENADSPAKMAASSFPFPPSNGASSRSALPKRMGAFPPKNAPDAQMGNLISPAPGRLQNAEGGALPAMPQADGRMPAPSGMGAAIPTRSVLEQGRRNSASNAIRAGAGGIGPSPAGDADSALMRGLLWLIFALLLGALWTRRRSFRMALRRMGWPLSARKAGRERERSAPVNLPGATASPSLRTESKPQAAPGFAFTPPILARAGAVEWLDALLATPESLLEPALRRVAGWVVEANPNASFEKALPLLDSPQPRMRVIGAALLAPSAPKRAEAALLAVLEDERAPAEARAEASGQLARLGGDRYEDRWLRLLLGEGSLPATRALCGLPRLDATTLTALQQMLGREPGDLRGQMLTAQIACTLGVHGALPPDEAETFLRRLPPRHRDSIETGALRGLSSPWAVERLVEGVLRGHAYPALHALTECDPTLVQAYLATRREGLDGPARTRAAILDWLIFRQGETEAVRRLADAGNDLATGAMRLSRAYHWNPASASSDALLAGAQIASLRLGFTAHDSETIAGLFRASASESETEVGREPNAAPELEPLARAYAHPEVYGAAQAALHAEDGLPALLTTLARRDDPRGGYASELAFWSDKTPSETRLALTGAIANASHEALASRAADPCPAVRAACLRALTAQAALSKEASPPAAPESLPVAPLDRAA